MIKHIVLLDLPDEYDEVELFNIMLGLGDLIQKIPGFIRFEHGPNKDFEGKSSHHSYGFICHFTDEEVSQRYLVDPGHVALGKRLVEMCNGGAAGIMVIDLAVSAQGDA